MDNLTLRDTPEYPAATLHPSGCPLCGHKPAKRAKRTEPAAVDTSAMNEAELFAYYKRTANVEDARFALKYNLPMSDELRAEWQVLADLASKLSRVECRKRLYALQVRRFDWVHATMPTASTRGFFTATGETARKAVDNTSEIS